MSKKNYSCVLAFFLLLALNSCHADHEKDDVQLLQQQIDALSTQNALLSEESANQSAQSSQLQEQSVEEIASPSPTTDGSSSTEEESALDLIEIKPISIYEEPGEDGFKTLNFTLVYENPSDEWVYFDDNVIYSTIQTSDGYEYDLSSCNGYIAETIIMNTFLPPGFWGQSKDISCEVGEGMSGFSLAYLLKARIENEQSDDWPVIQEDWEEKIISLDKTYSVGSYPFIDPEGWEGYRNASQSNIQFVEPGQTIDTPFGYIIYEEISGELSVNWGDFLLSLSIYNDSPAHAITVRLLADVYTPYEYIFGRLDSTGYDDLEAWPDSDNTIGPLQEKRLVFPGDFSLERKDGNIQDKRETLQNSDFLCVTAQWISWEVEHESQDFYYPHIVCFDLTK